MSRSRRASSGRPATTWPSFSSERRFARNASGLTRCWKRGSPARGKKLRLSFGRSFVKRLGPRQRKSAMRAKAIRGPAAERDLRELVRHISRNSPRAADRFIKAVEKTLVRLARMPEIAPRWEGPVASSAELRVWPVHGFKKYLIFYEPIPEGIDVVRVLHGSRDLDTLLQ